MSNMHKMNATNCRKVIDSLGDMTEMTQTIYPTQKLLNWHSSDKYWHTENCTCLISSFFINFFIKPFIFIGIWYIQFMTCSSHVTSNSLISWKSEIFCKVLNEILKLYSDTERMRNTKNIVLLIITLLRFFFLFFKDRENCYIALFLCCHLRWY